MIGELKPYAEYADSGHDWLGSIPAHWGLLRAKRLFREVDERSTTGKEELLSVSHITGVTPRRLKTVTMFMAESNVGHKVCRPGDLVINTLWAWMGALGVTRHTGIVSPAYGVYRPLGNGGILPGYADHLLRTPLYAAEYQRRSTGVNSSRLRLYPEQFLRVPVLVPPVAEQAAIVRFLRWATGRLDHAIRAKRKVIALLTEQKQGVINRAVTLGLNQAVMHKPTGVSCLGDIPKHWEQRALWTLSKLRAERNPTGLPLLSVFLDRGVIRYEDGGGQVHAPSLDLANYQVVRAGDFVLNNQQAWRGSVGVSIHDGIISPAYFVLQLYGDLDSGYANHLMRSTAMVGQFVTSSKGVGDIQRSVFWPFLRMVQVPVPPIEEQRSIVRYVQKATASVVS